MNDYPKKIYLQRETPKTSFDPDEVTWCEDQIDASDVEYARVSDLKPSHITTWEAVDDLHTHYLNAKGTLTSLRRLQMLTEIKEELEAEWPELGPKGC